MAIASHDIVTATTYYDSPSKANTAMTLSLAKKRSVELGIKTVVVATTSGDTAVKAAEAFPGYRVIGVSHAHGFKEPNVQEMTAANKAAFEAKGGIVLTTGHAFAGIGRAIRKRLNTYEAEEIVSHTLKMVMGQGIKVVCEIALMAADAGLVRTDEEVIAIAGTGHGADTAVVIKPANSSDFFDLRVKEIICKVRG
ncbi:MAG: hypothetical protein HYY32_03515 [Chloroflexi bacterium]|nr:hypothetical protein [Chloroflexota bacterium]